MSPVLPIDTQRYQSGDYTLEVTARPSPLSQWSARPVVRQLRFNLWSEQPERQRLAAGDQHQLVTLSDAVETYVQRHLTQQAWPQTHRLTLLEQEIEFSTLQLFNLAEVLSAYGQGQITLPAFPRQSQLRRRRPRWRTGSAAASLLVAVGVTTAYLYYRPAVFNEVATTQAPADVLEDKVVVLPEANTPSEGGSAAPSAPSLERAPAEDRDVSGSPERKASEDLAQQPLESTELDSVRAIPVPTESQSAASTNTESSFDVPAAEALDPEEIMPEAERLELNGAMPEIAKIPESPEPAAAPREPMATVAVGESEQAERLGEAAGGGMADTAAGGDLQRSRIATEETASGFGVLDAIATQLAPYQPTEANYPLMYHLQIASNGTIIAIEPIGENVPAIMVSNEVINPAPGRSLKVEVIYTGDNRPVVNELFE